MRVVAALHARSESNCDAAELLAEWLSYTGLRDRAFDPSLDPEKAESILREAWSRITEYRKVSEGNLN
jgi:hypothetical protein